jgi:hypothetical protein
MRTKTLLLTAAIGAAGIASSMAQAVYSVNYVGYVNKSLLPGYNLIANPLKNGNNSPDTIFTAPNFGDTIYQYNNVSGAFASASYFGSWLGESLTLAPGDGFFYFNAGGAPLNVTFVGEGEEGPNLMNPIPAGLSIKASRIPQAGTLAPVGPGGGQLEFITAPNFGDTVYQFDAATQGYISSSWFGVWAPTDPNIAVAEAFWYQNNGAATNWERDYEVTP